MEGLLAAAQRIVSLDLELSDVFAVQLAGTKSEELLLELLKEKYSRTAITDVVEAFLSNEAGNLIAPYLLASSQQPVPLEYLALILARP